MDNLFWHPPTHPPAAPPPDLGAAKHRCRLALNDTLERPPDESAWDELFVAYRDMAAEWDEWVDTQPTYLDAVAAGLDRAGPAAWALEVGCGTGQATALLAAFAAHTIATDVNEAMLRLAPALPGVLYAAADVRRLPFADGSVPLLLGLNAVPALAEFGRVLAPGGQLLWCSSFGPGTPLYVPPDRLLSLLGEGWRGEAGQAGHGDWALFTRA